MAGNVCNKESLQICDVKKLEVESNYESYPSSTISSNCDQDSLRLLDTSARFSSLCHEKSLRLEQTLEPNRSKTNDETLGISLEDSIIESEKIPIDLLERLKKFIFITSQKSENEDDDFSIEELEQRTNEKFHIENVNLAKELQSLGIVDLVTAPGGQIRMKPNSEFLHSYQRRRRKFKVSPRDVSTKATNVNTKFSISLGCVLQVPKFSLLFAASWICIRHFKLYPK